MFDIFARLIDGQRDGSLSTWQGVLSIRKTPTSISQLPHLCLKAAGPSVNIDQRAYNWRFLIYNPKFDEYCDIAITPQRPICLGDKFEVVYTPKDEFTVTLSENWQNEEPITNGHTEQNIPRNAFAHAEIQNQAPLVFLDDDDGEEEGEDVKPVSLIP
jgi:hypothetical protein